MNHIYRATGLLLLGLLFVLGASLAESVVTPVEQSQYYQGTPDECRTTAELQRSTQTDFVESIPSYSGSSTTPLYFAIGVHIEPHREYLEEQRYQLDRERLRRLAELVERHGGWLTIQAQSPFTEKAAQLGDPLFKELADRGHEIALHFHEDAHIPNANSRPLSEWIVAFRREIELIARLSGNPVRTWSGGNLYQHVFEAAAQVGLEVNINYKNPGTQQIDARFMGLNPWRPAGAGSIEERTTHDPSGPIVYVPSGVYPAHCQGAEAVPHPYHYEAFDYVTVALRNSLAALAEGKINTFIATVHPGDFASPEDDGQELAIWEEWLTRVIDPLVASGRLRWATVSEMAQTFRSWEGALTGTEPAPSLNTILISWDGTQRAHLLELYGQGKLPNLAALAGEGIAIPMEVTHHATDTKAGHAEMLSGYGPDVTGVYDNKRYQAIPDNLTIFERLKAHWGQQIKTIAITGKYGNIEPLLVNAQSELDFSRFQQADAETVGPQTLRALETFANRPFLAFFHFGDPDSAGHIHGESSAEYSEGIKTCDRWLGEIVAELKELGIYEKTVIYVTADHGFDEGKKSHSDAPEIWLATNDPQLTEPQGGVANQADIVPTVLARYGLDPNQIEPPLPGEPLVPTSTIQVQRELIFATVAGVPLGLDAYIPPSPGPHPAIIFVHGGGWVKGDKGSLESYARYFAERGYVGFSVNYRLAPEFKFPAQIEDVKCAVRWVRQHAAEYNVDPERIGALGTSAGGHLVGLLGVTDGSEDLEGSCGDPAISSRVEAVVPYFGPMDLARLFSSAAGASAALALLGTTCEADPQACRAASPISYVSPDDPPFLLVHGTRDPLVPFEQSVLMREALQTASVEAELVALEGASHGWPIDSAYGQEALAQVVPFFEQHLQGSPAADSAVAPQANQCVAVQIQSVGEAKSFLTWLPSEAAPSGAPDGPPNGGIVVRVIYPNRPRYPEGTAAVVEVIGADESGSVGLPPRALQEDPFVAQGLIHALFAFPGGGQPPLNSGGIYDHRGLDSLKALRDVVSFLHGKLQEQNGCAIGDLVPYKITQLGLVGSSNGGNTAIVALGLLGEQMPVDWYVGWENPAGVQFTTVDLGARSQANPAYIVGSCRQTSEGAVCDVDYSHLRWDPTALQQGWGPQGGGRQGLLYHDLNGNGRYDSADYALGTYSGTFAGQEKRVYSVAALEATVARQLLDPWPKDVATLDETREFWRIRDMSRYYGDVIAKLSQLRAIVIGSRDDHVQKTSDYPHIVLQYRGWQEAGMEWVRLNPDAAYVVTLTGLVLPVVDNDANMVVDYSNIADVVELEIVSDPLLRLAAALELSDRVHEGNWQADLDQSLQ